MPPRQELHNMACGMLTRCALLVFAAFSSLVVPRVVVTAVAPDYPDIARYASIEGAVTVLITIDRWGHVKDAVVQAGPPLLRPSALAAAHRWQFDLEDGEGSLIVTFAYHLVPPTACFQRTLPKYSLPTRVDVTARVGVGSCSDCVEKPIRYEVCK
jgi:TonB family protein